MDARCAGGSVLAGCRSARRLVATEAQRSDDVDTGCADLQQSHIHIGAGVIALMLQQYRDTYTTTNEFLPSTAKAVLMNTATDLGNPGPDFQFGYGHVDAQAAVDVIIGKGSSKMAVGIPARIAAMRLSCCSGRSASRRLPTGVFIRLTLNKNFFTTVIINKLHN